MYLKIINDIDIAHLQLSELTLTALVEWANEWQFAIGPIGPMANCHSLALECHSFNVEHWQTNACSPSTPGQSSTTCFSTSNET